MPGKVLSYKRSEDGAHRGSRWPRCSKVSKSDIPFQSDGKRSSDDGYSVRDDQCWTHTLKSSASAEPYEIGRAAEAGDQRPETEPGPTYHQDELVAVYVTESSCEVVRQSVIILVDIDVKLDERPL